MTGSFSAPSLVILAGSNEAGKSTVAPAFDPTSVAFSPVRIMLLRAQELARARVNFAIETLLASRTLARIQGLIDEGYALRLVLMWFSNADLAMARVAERVRVVGHQVPEDAVRRRYKSGLRNFFQLNRPLTSVWRFYENSRPGEARLIASGVGAKSASCPNDPLWATIEEEHGHV